MERNAVVAAMPRVRRVFRNIPSRTLRLLPSGGRKLTSLLPIKRVTSVVAAFREMASTTVLFQRSRRAVSRVMACVAAF